MVVLDTISNKKFFVRLLARFTVEFFAVLIIIGLFFTVKLRFPTEFFMDIDVAQTPWSWFRDVILWLLGGFAVVSVAHLMSSVMRSVNGMFRLMGSTK